eukprot:m.16880 g.16880  ORF g.16880 m.16880 type:complete len:98 (-) comp11254_c1_seq1:31-324(-)
MEELLPGIDRQPLSSTQRIPSTYDALQLASVADGGEPHCLGIPIAGHNLTSPATLEQSPVGEFGGIAKQNPNPISGGHVHVQDDTFPSPTTVPCVSF